MIVWTLCPSLTRIGPVVLEIQALEVEPETLYKGARPQRQRHSVRKHCGGRTWCLPGTQGMTSFWKSWVTNFFRVFFFLDGPLDHHLFCANAVFSCAKASFELDFFFSSCSIADSFASIKRSLGTKMLRLGASQHNWKVVWRDLPRKLLGWNESEWSFSLLSQEYNYYGPRSLPLCPISAPMMIWHGCTLLLSSITHLCLGGSVRL